jgi:hypothetical protein
MPRILILIIFFLIGLRLFPQADSLLHTPDERLDDGIFLSYQDFRKNNSLKKAQIISKQDKDQLEFISKVVFEDKISFEENGSVQNVESKSVWGYMQNNTLYINYKGDFYRVPVFGSISYLVANVTVYNPGFYDPRFGVSSGSGTTKEIREFLMNYYDGIITPFTLQTAEDLLSRDAVLFEAYKKLRKTKRKEQIYGYIRKYNAAHPIYFLN